MILTASVVITSV